MKDFLNMLFGLSKTIVISVAVVVIVLLLLIGTVFGMAIG